MSPAAEPAYRRRIAAARAARGDCEKCGDEPAPPDGGRWGLRCRARGMRYKLAHYIRTMTMRSTGLRRRDARTIAEACA